MKNIYIVVGPTSSGKSDYAVNLALKIKGEIVSADSRQVYKELNLLSGKITELEMKGVPHHMLSIVSVTDEYSAELFANDAQKIILGILARGRTPIICGGTGFYIEALVSKLNDIHLPKVTPNPNFREKISKLTNEELFKIIDKKDPDRALTIDKNNRVRLVRALEIIEALGKVPKQLVQGSTLHKSEYNFIWVGLDFSNEKLKERIITRVKIRIQEGMLDEAKNVYKIIGPKKMKLLGLECKYTAQYIEAEFDIFGLVEILSTKIWQYAKRQRTWFKKNKSIEWVVS